MASTSRRDCVAIKRILKVFEVLSSVSKLQQLQRLACYTHCVDALGINFLVLVLVFVACKIHQEIEVCCKLQRLRLPCRLRPDVRDSSPASFTGLHTLCLVFPIWPVFGQVDRALPRIYCFLLRIVMPAKTKSTVRHSSLASCCWTTSNTLHLVLEVV